MSPDPLTVLRTMRDASVNCCITSPPYWGLRDYGTASWEGGDPGCKHSVGGQVEDGKAPGAITTGQRPGVDASACRKCGATRVDQQLGLERTPAEYVEKMVEVFREVRRVLRNDGTLWLNLGDSYNSNPAKGGSGPNGKNGYGEGYGRAFRAGAGRADGIVDERGQRNRNGVSCDDLKPKDLCGIPWRVALALQADGWYWRDCIVWHKPAPMPESVRDRCTKSWEPIFMFAKSERYYFDADAIREPYVTESNQRDRSKENWSEGALLRNMSTGEREWNSQIGRNKRNVWTLSPMATPDAHFATFPLELPETCLRAGCPEDGTVLDPFAGAGTTGLACLKQSRNFVGIELNPKYIEIAHNRAQKYYPLLMAPWPFDALESEEAPA